MKTMDSIPRPTYLNKILQYKGKEIIKVLTGQRRVGKSYLLNSIEETLRQYYPSANFIRINLEDFAFSHIKDATDLNNEIVKLLSETSKNYIFIDEIQEIEGFDKVIRSLCLDARNDIYVTGSNSSMLSSEMASRLAGRSVEIKIHPLSYIEYMQFQALDAYITNKVRRWDIEGKKFFEIGEKYYFEDIGIRNSIIGYRPMDIGAILENAIYNKLSADGYNVKVGIISAGKEIDFVAEKNGERKYIQAAVNIHNKATAQREFGNLEAIDDNYEKMLVTLRDSAPNTQNGIKMIALRDFLTTESIC